MLKNWIDDASHSRGESRAVRAVVRREKEKERVGVSGKTQKEGTRTMMGYKSLSTPS